MPPYTKFKGIKNIGDAGTSDIITTNLIWWANWGWLQTGAYFNVDIPKSGAYGGDESQFRPVTSPYYSGGRVWESFRKDWVWESGIDQQSTQPIKYSGVFVDNVFHSDKSNHYVDYVNGQIVFDTAIPTSSVVRAEYSHRWIHMYNANDVPWFRQVQYESHKIDTDQYLNTGSGDRSQFGQTRIQLPAVLVELIDGDYSPYSIGLAQNVRNDVIYHVMAEDGHTSSRIADVLSEQTDKTIFLFSPDLLAQSGVYPLNHNGSLVAGAKTYPQLVEHVSAGGFRWNKLYFSDGRKQRTNKIHQNIYITPVRVTTEVTLSSI